MSGLTTACFWLWLAAVAYAYAGYPLLIWLAARVFGRDDRPPEIAQADPPAVSLLIVAHNEQEVIAARLDNALATDYPPDKLEIVVACDGCSDLTPAIVRRYAHRGVRLLQASRRRGKSATLNWAIPQLTGDLIVLSDANTDVDPDAIRALVRRFADPRVGVACGQLLLTDPATGRNADGVYWKYENFLKRCEARLGALLGANGAIYALRRARYVPIPDNTIVDDFLIPLVARLRHRCTIVYEPGAIAREQTAPDVRAEFRRRARIGAGGFQAIATLWPLLHPRQGWSALAFFSHKLLRWTCPFFLLGALAASALLWPNPLYRAAFFAQLIFYALTLAAARLPNLPRPLRAAQMFTQMNRTQPPTWQPAARPAELRKAA
jgi:cellulose synthase/poly-beta-1,6-N-acetylglucosamine synthase-like glycosyltransferase